MRQAAMHHDGGFHGVPAEKKATGKEAGQDQSAIPEDSPNAHFLPTQHLRLQQSGPLLELKSKESLAPGRICL